MPLRRDSLAAYFRIKDHTNCHLSPTETMQDARYLGCPFRPFRPFLLFESRTMIMPIPVQAMAVRLNQLNQQPLPLRRNVGCLGRPRGRADERRRRSALSHGPRKLDRSHGRRGRDVYKYYTCCMLHGRTEGTHRSSNDISPFLPLPLEIRTGLSPVHKIVRTCQTDATGRL